MKYLQLFEKYKNYKELSSKVKQYELDKIDDIIIKDFQYDGLIPYIVGENYLYEIDTSATDKWLN